MEMSGKSNGMNDETELITTDPGVRVWVVKLRDAEFGDGMLSPGI